MEGEEAKEDQFEDNVNFFEAIMDNLKLKSSNNLIDCWYHDSGATKHVLGDKFSFKGVEK